MLEASRSEFSYLPTLPNLVTKSQQPQSARSATCPSFSLAGHHRRDFDHLSHVGELLEQLIDVLNRCAAPSRDPLTLATVNEGEIPRLFHPASVTLKCQAGASGYLPDPSSMT
jgi:hypothetical protein